MNFPKIGADAQLELPWENPNETKIETDMPDFPTFELSEETTPAAILAWWDQLVETFSWESDLAQPRLQSLRAEIAAAKGERTRLLVAASSDCVTMKNKSSRASRPWKSRPMDCSKVRCQNSHRA